MKKKNFITIVMLFCVMIASAQDVIVKKGGSTILAKVIRVGTSEVEYKKWNNLDGPIYNISKTDIMAINYHNGDKDIFDEQEQNNNQYPRLVKKNAAANNSQLINSYRTSCAQIEKGKDRNASYCTAYLDVVSSSILSNEDIEVSFEQNEAWPSASFDIVITNKTDHLLYIDKGNCFRTINKAAAYCYYNSTDQITVGSNSGGGISLGLGSIASVLGVGGTVGQLANGVTVNGGSSSSSSTTYSAQRLISLPPHMKKKLCENKVSSNGYYFEAIDPNENIKIDQDGGWGIFSWGYANHLGFYRGDIKLGQILTYDENNSPHLREYILTYSKDNNFNTYTTINFALYLHHIIGQNYNQNDAHKLPKNVILKDSGRKIYFEAKLDKR